MRLGTYHNVHRRPYKGQTYGMNGRPEMLLGMGGRPERLLGVSGLLDDTLGKLVGADTAKSLIDAGTNLAVSEITGKDGKVVGSGNAVSSAPASESFLSTTTGKIVVGGAAVVGVVLIVKLMGGKRRRRR